MKMTIKMMMVAFTVIAISNVASAKGNNRGNSRPQIQVIVIPPVAVVHSHMRPAPMMRPPVYKHRHHKSDFAHRRDFRHRGSVRNDYACR